MWGGARRTNPPVLSLAPIGLDGALEPRLMPIKAPTAAGRILSRSWSSGGAWDG